MLRDEVGSRRPILVDDLDGAVHHAYGLLPNMTWVAGWGGRIVYRSDWTSAANIEAGTTAGVWLLLAALRPDTTYHLAPALVTWSYPYLRLSSADPTFGEAIRAVAADAVAALALTASSRLGWLNGPALVGGGAVGES